MRQAPKPVSLVQLPSLNVLEQAAALVHKVMPPTPQVCWPLLCERLRAEVWVKHENHTPVGAFKIRGGLVYFDDLRRQHPEIKAVIAATRGNHGQSIAFAARRHGIQSTLVVPHGNSGEKNAAMRALGADLIEHGSDFQDAFEHAQRSPRHENSTWCRRSTRLWCVAWRAIRSSSSAQYRISTSSTCPSASVPASAAPSPHAKPLE